MGERVEPEAMEAYFEARVATLEAALRQRGQQGTLERLSMATRRRRVHTLEPRMAAPRKLSAAEADSEELEASAQDEQSDDRDLLEGGAETSGEGEDFGDAEQEDEDEEEPETSDDRTSAELGRPRGDSEFTVETTRSAAPRGLGALNDEIWRFVGKFFGDMGSSPESGSSRFLRRLSMGRRDRGESVTSSNGSRRATRRDTVFQEQTGEVQDRFEAYLQGSRPNIWHKVIVCIFPSGVGVFAREEDIADHQSVIDLFFDKLVLPTGNPVDIMKIELSRTRFAYAMHTEYDTFILAAASKASREDHVERIQSAYEQYIETEIRRRAVMQITWQIATPDSRRALRTTREAPLYKEMQDALLGKLDEDLRHLVHSHIVRKALHIWSAIARHSRARRAALAST
ncbi:Hypothetical Protein FCC1311_002782 [Hondaea fermentalgiana]|uniref:Uncharacterized protein n=1 Tax=Hondaea fermentalgiana TaxID=2315210 RepID=A0A2R5FZB0_9STRA|nr:Hypothetical Protein FCC1311_002782 [Hondaea fermentalgiana]|eukprot:GBG24060.1 Hypothetical Protein FCC1311_002782 [Hondaea fermentalgiana]